MTDELVQIRGGRGYETADSLRARGEKPIPVEQVMRDMRINRTFEGSSEIMHLLIAREAVDQHLEVAGDILDGDVEMSEKAKAAVGAGKFYAKWLPQLLTGKGTSPSSYEEFGDLAKHIRFVERNSRKLARSTFWGMSRWQAGLEKRQSFLGRIVDIGAELFAISSTVVYAQTIANEHPEPRRERQRARRPVLQPGAAADRHPVPRPVVQRRRPGATSRRWPCSTASTPGSRRA